MRGSGDKGDWPGWAHRQRLRLGEGGVAWALLLLEFLVELEFLTKIPKKDMVVRRDTARNIFLCKFLKKHDARRN